jgi:trimeric autotransporter adhesin
MRKNVNASARKWDVKQLMNTLNQTPIEQPQKGLLAKPGRPSKLALIFSALTFACFALLNSAQAVSPAPTGGYPGDNTAEGQNALLSLTTNVALGEGAGYNSTGSGNMFIGAGMAGLAGENNSCYIGSIFGQTSSGGTPVYINSVSKLGTTTSSRRFKEDIKPMENASEALFALQPVTFRYKKEIDSRGIPQFGLIAEDVEKVNPDLVVRDKEGKVNTVRYEQINAMLLNEFLKEHKAFIEGQAKVKKLEAGLAELLATVKEQAAEIKKVNVELQNRKPIQSLARNLQ